MNLQETLNRLKRLEAMVYALQQVVQIDKSPLLLKHFNDKYYENDPDKMNRKESDASLNKETPVLFDFLNFIPS